MQITSRISNLKRFFIIPGEPQPGEHFYLLLLAFCYGAYFLLTTIVLYSPGGVVESEEFLIYVQGWISVPLLTLLAVLAVRAFKHRYFQDDYYFYPLLAGISLLTGLMAAFSLSLSWQVAGSPLLSAELSFFVMVMLPLIQVLSLRAIRGHRAWLAYRIKPKHILLFNWIFPFAIALFLLNFCGLFASNLDYRVPLWTIFAAIIFGTALHFISALFGAPWKRIAATGFDVLAALFIILSCFDPKLTTDIHHQDFYMGPVNALLNGRTILVDVYSQYGVFVIELLASIFRFDQIPLTYPALSLLNALLTMLQFGIIYFLMRVVFKSVGLAFLGLVVAVLLNLFATVNIFQSFPSIGPLRFGPGYLLAAIIALRLKVSRFRRALAVLEYAILGLASIWSFETFIYVAAIFVVSRVYQTLLEWQSFQKFIQQILLKLVKTLGMILIFQGAQALFIFFRAGQWPNWGIYFDYLIKYSTGGYGTLLVDPWGPWLFLVMIYFTLIMSLVLVGVITHRLEGSPEIQTMLYLSCMGVAQLTYFVGRSHPNNLLHISVPAIFLVLYGFQRLVSMKAGGFSGFTHSISLLFYASLVMIMIVYGPIFIEKLPTTAFPTLQSWLSSLGTAPERVEQFVKQEMAIVNSRTSGDPQVQDTVNLISKYAAGAPRVAVFISPVGTTQAIVLSKKANIYPISDPIQDSISSKSAQLILDTPTPLRTGDIIFLVSDPVGLNIANVNEPCAEVVGTAAKCVELQNLLAEKLCGQFGLDEIETTPGGITAMRLAPSGSGTADYCSRLNTFLGIQDSR